MYMHDHEKDQGPKFCPLMKEMCNQGWTPSMGVNKETSEKPKCVRWVGVFINNPQKSPPIYEVFDCKDRWQPDLIQQVASESSYVGRSSDQIRNRMDSVSGGVRGLAQVLMRISHNQTKLIEMSGGDDHGQDPEIEIGPNGNIK